MKDAELERFVLWPGVGVPKQRCAADRESRPLSGHSIALIHEWFAATGGSENVFRHIAKLLPQARRFVLWREPGAEAPDLRESWLARTPLRHSKALALPLMPLVWRTLTRERFDIVISSSHAFAHTTRLRNADDQTRYLSYVHSPARYVWSPAFDGRGANPLLTLPRRVLQSADLRLSRHVHSYAANSQEVRERIRRYWHRDAVVVNPPVDVDYYTSAPAEDRDQPRDYLLGVGRWIPYKNFPLVIAIAEAAGLPLVVAGSGPEEANLRRLASHASISINFEVRPDKERLRRLYWGARALLFPVHEDFGIIPVEAQACGTPVVGLRRGGLLETVADGETGHLVDSLEPRRYAAALDHLDELSRDRASERAAAFSEQAFTTNLYAWIDDAVR